MRAVFKSKLLVTFDRAIQDAKRRNYDLLCFRLESEEENELFREWIDATDHGGYVHGEVYEYEGVPIMEFYAGSDSVCGPNPHMTYEISHE